MVAQRPSKPCVAGSSPVSRSSSWCNSLCPSVLYASRLGKLGLWHRTSLALAVSHPGDAQRLVLVAPFQSDSLFPESEASVLMDLELVEPQPVSALGRSTMAAGSSRGFSVCCAEQTTLVCRILLPSLARRHRATCQPIVTTLSTLSCCIAPGTVRDSRQLVESMGAKPS